MLRVSVALWIALSASPLATAAPVDSIRLGLLEPNVCVADCNNANKEDGPSISGEVVFASPGLLAPIGSPNPYLAVSGNLAGDTSFAAAGLQWQWRLADGWSLETGIGYSVHDGQLSFPFPQGDPRNDPFTATSVLLGSRDLFRSSLAINRDLGEHWAVQLHYEHFSHGQILGSGRNQGMDNAGLRLVYRFTP